MSVGMLEQLQAARHELAESEAGLEAAQQLPEPAPGEYPELDAAKTRLAHVKSQLTVLPQLEQRLRRLRVEMVIARRRDWLDLLPQSERALWKPRVDREERRFASVPDIEDLPVTKVTYQLNACMRDCTEGLESTPRVLAVRDEQAALTERVRALRREPVKQLEDAVDSLTRKYRNQPIREATHRVQLATARLDSALRLALTDCERELKADFAAATTSWSRPEWSLWASEIEATRSKVARELVRVSFGIVLDAEQAQTVACSTTNVLSTARR